MKALKMLLAVPFVLGACSPSGASAPSSSHLGDAGPGPDDAHSAGEADAPATTFPEVSWQPCDTSSWPPGYPLPTLPTQCATVNVPRYPGTADTSTFELRVARQVSGNPEARALFVLEGGPGGSAVFTSGMVPAAMPALHGQFDFIYVDARGTGGSQYADCKNKPQTLQDWDQCVTDNAGLDLDQYLSRIIAADIEHVRMRLGYGAIYIFAVSYGTRVAFEYLRQYPKRVVAGVLDSVSPPPTDLFANSLGATDRGVAQLVEDCTADPVCSAAAPSLAFDIVERQSQLTKAPRAILVGATAAVETATDYNNFLTAALSQTTYRYRLPKAIAQSVQGNHAAWNQLISAILGVSVSDPASTAASSASAGQLPPPMPSLDFGPNFLSRLVNGAVLCAEALPNAQSVAALDAQWAQLQFPTNVRVLNLAHSCGTWPVTVTSASERELVQSETPLLLLSGAVDVNLDPKWAAVALGQLPNAQHLTIPYSTHLPTYNFPQCVGAMSADFLRTDGDMSQVPTGCVAAIPQPAWQ